MATASSVNIVIAVDPTDSAAKIGAVSNELEQIGTAATSAGVKTGQAMGQMTGHVATGLDSVRLLSQEFGLKMPRAIEAMLSRIPAVTAALSSIVGVMAGIAAVEIFARLGEEIYKAFDLGGQRARAMAKDVEEVNISLRRMQDETALQIDKLQQEHAAFEHKPFNAMKLSLDEASVAADAFAGKMEEIDSKILKAVADMGNGGGFGGAVTHLLKGSASTGYEQTMLEQHQKWMALAASPADQGKEIDKYTASLQQRLAQLNDVHFRASHASTDFSNEVNATQEMLQFAGREKSQYNADGTLTTAEQQKQKDEAAKQGQQQAKEAAKEAARQREDAVKEIARLEAEANQAGVRDEALSTQKRLAEIAQVEARLRELHATTAQLAQADALVNKKFDDERTKLIQEQVERAEKALRDAQSAGLTGVPKAEAERTARLADIDATDEDPRAKALRSQAVQVEYNQEMTRLRDEADKREAAQQQKQSERIQANQVEDLRSTQEATQAEARVRENGALGWIASYKNAVTEIESQETQRLAKLKQDAAKEDLTYAEVAQRKADIDRMANAEIAEQNQRLQQQIAGTLQSAFKDPVGTIKSEMEKLMFDILAQWLIHLKAFQSVFGHLMGGMTPGGGQTGGALANLTRPGGALQSGSGIAGGVIANLIHGGAGGGTAMGGSMDGAAAGFTGSAPAAAAASFRAPYSGNSGLVTGAGSSASIGADIGTARSLIGSFAGGGGSMPTAVASTAQDSGVQFDAQGNATVNDTIPLQSTPRYQMPSGQGGMGTAMGMLGAAGAAWSAEQTTVSAFDQGSVKGILSGTLGDAAAGATIGSVIPGIGTAVGAAVGAAVGFASGVAGAVLGMGGRIAARDYYEKTLYPAIEADRVGQSDPMSAVSDINRTASQGYDYMQGHWGESAAVWVKSNYMDKEVAMALSQISQHAAGGSQYLQRQAVQYHTGGYIGGFGDLGTSGNEGFIHALMGEAVMNTSAVARHAPAINAMNDGASASDVAAMYLRGSGSNANPSASSGGGDTHFHIHTLDTQTMSGWLRNGGARMIAKAQNNLAGQYAGEGVIG